MTLKFIYVCIQINNIHKKHKTNNSYIIHFFINIIRFIFVWQA